MKRVASSIGHVYEKKGVKYPTAGQDNLITKLILGCPNGVMIIPFSASSQCIFHCLSVLGAMGVHFLASFKTITSPNPTKEYKLFTNFQEITN